MSIATEIQRLQTAKANIKTAIESKGVEVGDGLIDTYAEKIAEISSGSDVIDFARYASKVEFGSSDWAKEETTITLERAKKIEHFWYGFKDNVVKHLTLNCLKPITSLQRAFLLSVDNKTSPNSIERITINADTSQCTTFYQAFCCMYNLKVIDGTPLDLSSSNDNNMFSLIENLEEIRFKEGSIAITTKLSSSQKLSIDSLLSIINGLKDYREDTSGKTYTLTLGATNLAKLTDEQKAIATEKGWTLA
jgi:hypothetical protein